MIQIDDIQFNEEYYDLLIQLLMNSTGLNLDYYRTNFIEKRIKSRMLRVNCGTLESYYKYLLKTPSETHKFLDCFNINYSVFFRNWEVFEQFEKILLTSLYLTKKDIISDLNPNPERQYRNTTTSFSSKNENKKSKNTNNGSVTQYLSLTYLLKIIDSSNRIYLKNGDFIN